MMMEYTCMKPIHLVHISHTTLAQLVAENTVIDYFESNWKANMTLNAAMKLGLEALRHSNDEEQNGNAVEVSVIDASGYRVLDREEVNKQIDRLKPLRGINMVSLDDAVYVLRRQTL